MPGHDERYRSFFEPIVEQLHHRGWTGARTAQPQPFLFVGSEWHHLHYEVRFAGAGRLVSGMVIRAAADDLNKAVFDQLLARRTELETPFGQPLDWNRRDGHHSSAVFAVARGRIDDPPPVLSGHGAWVLDRLALAHEILLPVAADLLAAGPEAGSLLGR